MVKSQLELIEETPTRVVYRLWRRTHGPGAGHVPGMHPRGCVFLPTIVGLIVIVGLTVREDSMPLWAKIGCGIVAAPLLFLLVAAVDMGGGLSALPAQIRETVTKRDVWQHVRIVLDGEARRISLEGEDPRHPYGHSFDVDHIDSVIANPELRYPSFGRHDGPCVYLFMNERHPPTMVAGHEVRLGRERIELPSDQDAERLAAGIRALFGLPETEAEVFTAGGRAKGYG